ncbi:hypothetical protein BH18ACI3_BH18ACI3_14890 [soil metagenome]
MNSKVWIRKALSASLCVTVLATYSMVALANSGKIAGELLISGVNAAGETPVVMVNGEEAKSGRSIFSSSMIATPENASAVINMGKAGKVELAPNTTVTLSFDDRVINGQLTSGKLTVLGSSGAVNIKTIEGNYFSLNSGESVSAVGKAQVVGDDDGGAGWWILGGVLAGAAAVIIYAATRADNRVELGGSGIVVSPTR